MKLQKSEDRGRQLPYASIISVAFFYLYFFWRGTTKEGGRSILGNYSPKRTDFNHSIKQEVYFSPRRPRYHLCRYFRLDSLCLQTLFLEVERRLEKEGGVGEGRAITATLEPSTNLQWQLPMVDCVLDILYLDLLLAPKSMVTLNLLPVR